MMRIKRAEKLSTQVKRQTNKKREEESERTFNFNTVISTGSTLLDLAISGEILRGGGIPGGILVEVFGPSGCGKTVMLCEIAGAIQRQGGNISFFDPEARLNIQFARMFDFDTDKMKYKRPDTVREIFRPFRKIKSNEKPTVINGIIADSLAALSTDMEMEDKDKMGMRRAKEFSEELRKSCRIMADNNILMVCSNQIRQNFDAGPYGPKNRTTGGKALEFYSSLRLECMNPIKIPKKIKIHGKTFKKIVGVTTSVKVCKNSIASPYNIAPVTIIFDYGIDDTRENLKYVKQITGAKSYMVNDIQLGKSLNEAIKMVESDKLVRKLRNQVINLWTEINNKFKEERLPKRRL